MTTIRINELQPGDLLFSYEGTNEDIPGITTTSKHVAIVTSSDFAGKARIVHQVEGGIRVMRGGVKTTNMWNGTIEGDVRPGAADALEGDETSRNLNRVMRCKNKILRAAAAQQAKAWGDNHILPFGMVRVSRASKHEGQFGLAKFHQLVHEHRQLFHKSGKFRAIKYATRRNTSLNYIGGQEHGIFCSMFVALAYQIAGIASQVEDFAGSDKIRVSDKKMSAQQAKKALPGFNPEDLIAYNNYCNSLRESNPYELLDLKTTEYDLKAVLKQHTGTGFLPSVKFWKGSKPISQFDWASAITKGMMLDAKIVFPGGLIACLQDDPENWEDKGYIVGPTDPASWAKESLEKQTARLDRRYALSKVVREFAGGKAEHPMAGFRKE